MPLRIEVNTEPEVGEEQNETLAMQRRIEFDADEISERGVYVGSLRSTSRVEEMKKRNIKYILNLSCRSSSNLEAITADGQFVQLTVNVLDSVEERIITRFEECLAFISQGLESGNKVLVCCSRGISRSVTIGCAYLMKSEGLDFKAALKKIQSCRKIAAPHFSFIGQLYVFQEHGLNGNVSDEDFQNLYSQFTGSVTPQEIFTDQLTLSLSMTHRDLSDEDCD